MLRAVALAAAAASASAAGATDTQVVGGLEVTLGEAGHYWPNSRGPGAGTGALEHEPPPADLSSHLAWSWKPPQDLFQSVIAGGPVIDMKKNLFVAASDGLRKFTPDGKVLWHHKAYGSLVHQPALMGSVVFTSHADGGVMAFDIETGHVVFSRRYTSESPREALAPAGHGDKWVFGTRYGEDPRRPGGAKLAWALKAATGELTWSFRGDYAFMNFAPLFPGDGTMILMDFTGQVYRVNMTDGSALWQARPRGNHRSFSEGGATLGPDNVIYTCSNPGRSWGVDGEEGVLRAYTLNNGTLLWEQILPHPCNTHPSVAPLNKDKGVASLSVVVTPGARLRKPELHGSIMAFDAKTGNLQWRYQAPRLNGPMAATNLLFEGSSTNRSEFDKTCWPVHWSGPRVAADGSVWAARADGKIYNVKGPDHATVPRNPAGVALAESESKLGADFESTAGVKVQQTAVNGPSTTGAMAFAPGLTAMTTCDTLYVFKH